MVPFSVIFTVNMRNYFTGNSSPGEQPATGGEGHEAIGDRP